MDKILRGGLLLTMSNMGIRFLGYFYRILMGRFLAPSEFGLLNLALPLQYLIVLLASTGIAPSVARFVAKERRKGLVSSCLVYYGLAGAAMGAVFYLAAEAVATKVYGNPDLTELIKISSLAFPLGAVTASLTGAFQGYKMFGFMAWTLLVQQAMRILFALALVFMGMGAVGAIMGSTLGFLAAIPLALVFLKRLSVGKYSVKFREFKKVFLFSLPISTTSMATFALAYADILLIGYYLSPFDVGVYSAASPTSRLILAFTSALYAVLLPSISELKAERSVPEVRAHLQRTYLLSAGGLIPVVLLSILFAEDIISLLFPGEGYAGAVEPFKVLLVGSTFLGIFTINSAVFQGVGHPGTPMKIMAAAAVADVILNVILIPAMGIMGAAYATSLSFALAGVSSTLLLRKYL